MTTDASAGAGDLESQGRTTAPDPASWSRRLVRVALGLLLLGAIGLLMVVITLGFIIDSGTGDYAGSPEQYPQVHGTAGVTIEDQSLLGLYYLSGGDQGSPDGTCEVTDPQGEALPEEPGAVIQSPGIDGEYYVGTTAFVTTGPGVYTVTCEDDGHVAGPAYRTGAPGPGIDRDTILGAVVLTGAALMLCAAPTMPLLLAALIVRLVQGPRTETAGRRRRERGLALLVVGGLGALGQMAVTAIVVAGALVDPEGATVADAMGPVLLALPVLLVLLILAGLGALRVRGGRRAARTDLDPTVP